ncbi:MAG: protein TolR [Rhizobiales bacterium]|nr:protein TolR [Hyphomicrobiales bacterium]
MGASLQGSSRGKKSGRRARHMPLAEINVTPFVDVMLVLLIIFMVTAPLLTVGVPIELPKTRAKQISSNQEPLTVTLSAKGDIFLMETAVTLDELAPRLQAIAASKGGTDEAIFVRGDSAIDYGQVMRVMGRISAAGFTKVSLITDIEGS